LTNGPQKRRRKKAGALNRDRTGDLILTMDALYQLSYESVWLPEQDSNL
jgi:hypothetical protein